MWTIGSLQGSVISVSLSAVHGFSKQVVDSIEVVAGFGVAGDCHAGERVQHLYRVRKNPAAKNLCQVHLLQSELFAELESKGIVVAAGEIGENVALAGVDLLSLPVGSLVRLGNEALVEITGLRDPCSQMKAVHPDLMKACISRDADGKKLRRAGVMGTAADSGLVRAGDLVAVTLPAEPWRRMGPV